MKTDSQLQQDVSAELDWEPSVRAEGIGVEVKEGVVTLAGQVNSHTEKCNAEQAALRVSGVKAVITELKVQLTSLSRCTDAAIAQAAENALDSTWSLIAGVIQVTVEMGWITLSGAVVWQYQRQAAIDSVRHLLGVTGVSDMIRIKPSLTAEVMKSEIEAALKRTSIADAQKISVAVHGNLVMLSGTVEDWHERDTATQSAWGSPGVRNVVDRMTVAC